MTPLSESVASVMICDTQPVTAEGLRALLTGSPDLKFGGMAGSLPQASSLMRETKPDLLIVDKAFGIQAILDWLATARELSTPTAIVVWGVSVTEAEALRFLQCGAKGILRKTA